MRAKLTIIILLLLLGFPVVFAPISDAGTTYLPMAFVPPPTPTPRPLTGPEILLLFKAAGLEAERVHMLTDDEYGLAPKLCQNDAWRFYIPSLGPNKGGRLFVCSDPADASTLKAYYDGLSNASPLLFSWAFQNDGVLVQLNGELSASYAAKYAVVIKALP